MKNSFGQSVCLTLFGESHGAAVGCVIDGLAPVSTPPAATSAAVILPEKCPPPRKSS